MRYPPCSIREEVKVHRLNFHEPILAGDYTGPSIVKVGKEFYMKHTSARYARDLLIWKSLDLIHWTPVTQALNVF